MAIAHEPFADDHLHLLRTSPFRHTFALGYTNGLQGYLPTAAALALGEGGGYEASPRGAALSYETTRPLAPRVESMLREGLAAGAARSAVPRIAILPWSSAVSLPPACFSSPP